MAEILPALFISHGSPMLALENAPTTQFLQKLSHQFKKPSAIIVASAHWETTNPMLTGAENPETIYDFHGFPEELYKLKYPAKGHPQLAELINVLLNDYGYKTSIDKTRGFDHGVWNPLLLMYPEANIPVIELSVQPQKDALWHYNIGKALAPLRQENILILGTGNLTHNLREAFRGANSNTPKWVTEFAKWVLEHLEKGDVESLLKWDELAPYAHENHPTPEHFLPFFTALGAASKPLQIQHLHKEIAMGVLAMDAYAFA